jgi:hypothetical protein
MMPLQWRPTAITEQTMTTSDSSDTILSRLATRNDGEPTTVGALAEWLVSGECPPDVIRTAAWSILELITKSEDWAASGLVDVVCTVHQPFGERLAAEGDPDTDDGRYADTLRPSREPRTQTRIKLNSVGDVVVDYTGRLVSSSGTVSATDETFSIAIRIADLLAFWNGLPVDDRPRDGFPLEILYVAWLNRPQLVTPNARATGRIIPAKLAQVAPGDRQAGKLFTIAAHVAHIAPETGSETGQLTFSGFQQSEAARQQFILPGFKESTAIGPCLPLALYDLGDAPATSRGPAAPLPLRLFVESVLAVPMDSRDAHTPVAMRVTLRQMLDWLYPSRRKPRPNEYWPRLMAAFEALESPAARIPWYDPETGRGGSRRIVNISDIPRGPAKLDDLISIIVDLPPGSGNGPQVSDNLRQWGIKSAAGYRALLNLAYRWFEPGRTHFPVGRGRRRYWTQVNDPERYPTLAEDEIIALCFPTSARSARRNVLSDARKVIRQLEHSGELRVVEGRGSTMRILPPNIDASPCG